MLWVIDLPHGDFSPHHLAHFLQLVSPSDWDQHFHDLITGGEEEQFVFVLWPYGPISRVTTPQSLQDTRSFLSVCVCVWNNLGDPPGHLTPPPVATYTNEASPCAIWPATTAWIVRDSQHTKTHTQCVYHSHCKITQDSCWACCWCKNKHFLPFLCLRKVKKKKSWVIK